MTNPTDVAITVGIIAALAWEGWTLANRRPGDTISESVWRVVRRQPLVPFLLGLLCGHFLWLPSTCWEVLR